MLKSPLALVAGCLTLPLSLLATEAQALDLVVGDAVDGSNTYAGVRYRDLDAATNTQDAFLGARFDDGANRRTGRVIWAQGTNAFTFSYDPNTDSLNSVVTNSNGTYSLSYTGVAQRIADQSAFTIEDLNVMNILVLERQPGDDTLAVNNLRVNGALLGNIASRSSFAEPGAGIRNFCFSNGFTLTGDIEIDGPFSGSSELSKVEFALGVDGPRGVECVEPNDLALTLAPQADTATPGETRDIVVSVINNGPFSALDNVVAITLDEGLSHVDTGACMETDMTGRNLTCDLADLASGVDGEILLRVAVDNDAAFAPAGISATVSSRIYDEDLTDNTDTASILVQEPVPAADIGVTLVANPSPVNAGETVSYTATLGNSGPDLATNARALVSFDPAFAYSFPGNCTVGSDSANCPLGDVAAGDTADLLFEAPIPSDATGSVAVTVTVLSDAEDGDDSGNQAQTITDIEREADLAVTLVSNDTDIEAGDLQTATLTATNAGPSDQPMATITSAISPAINGLAWTCEAAGGASCPAANGTGNIAAQVSLPVGASLVYTLTGTPGDDEENLFSSASISTADDPDTSNNTDSLGTTVTIVRAQTSGLHTVADTGDGRLDIGESTDAPITQLLIRFDRDMATTGEGSVTDLDNFQLFAEPADAAPTTACGSNAENRVALEAIVYDAGTQTAALQVDLPGALPASAYTLLACAGLETEKGVSLDTDIPVPFTVSRDNLGGNPTFDDELGPWVGEGFAYDALDADLQPTSGSALASTLGAGASTVTLSQCVVGGAESLEVFAAKLSSSAALNVQVSADYFAAEDCSGDVVGQAMAEVAAPASVEFAPVLAGLEVPRSARAATARRLVITMDLPAEATVFVDDAVLRLGNTMFKDGFEPGQ